MKKLIFSAATLLLLSGCQTQSSRSAEEKATSPAISTSGQATETAQPPNSVLHKAATRGESNAGWLLSKHTFSFSNYYDPDRMNFGLLRVLNDDWVAGGGGFPTHPHQDMEIISIPLEGGLQHRDNSGGEGTIVADEVQIMSAGTGIRHSEFNASKTAPVRFLQIWVFPEQRGLKPRYGQKRFSAEGRKNQWQTVVSPHDPEAVFIHQKAVFTRGDFDSGKQASYEVQFPGNGVYTFVLEGSCRVNGQPLERRDGYGLWEVERLQIEATADAQLLLIEVPMISQ